MRKIYILAFVLLAPLFARENPFAPLSELDSKNISSGFKQESNEFKKQVLKFPSDARVLLSVSLRYRTGDGTIKEKVIQDINQAIDKSGEYALQKLDVSVTNPKFSAPINMQASSKKSENLTDINAKVAPNLNASKTQLKAPKEYNKTQENSDKKPNSGLTIAQTQLSKTDNNQENKGDIKFLNLSFKTQENSLKITTNSELIKHLPYEKNRLILDLSNPPKIFNTKTFALGGNVFKTAVIGWHKDYSRVVLTLDKKREYEIKKLADGYEIITK